MNLDLVDTLRSTGAVREFHPEPVARPRARTPPRHGPLRPEWRQPSGLARHRGRGRRPPASRCATLYLSGWYEYLAMVSAGLVPWAPVTDREAEAAAIADAGAVRRSRRRRAGLRRDARGRPRPAARPGRPVRRSRRSIAICRATRLAGGASIYPFVWSVLLAARAEGLAGVMTTMPVRREDEVRALFAIPETVAVASLVVLGRPLATPRRLRRAPVGSFAWVDRYEGTPLGGTEGAST